MTDVVEPSDAPRGVEHDSEGVDPSTLARRFADFATSFPHLRLYRAICIGAANDSAISGLLTSARPGQARPVLFLAALHDLVLRRSDLPAARWYPSVTGDAVPDGDPWPDVRAAVLDHESELRERIATRSTQTNEVGRAATLAPLMAAASADVADAPAVLVELGCSAGLLSNLDRYDVRVECGDGAVVGFGDTGSPVHVTATTTGPTPSDRFPDVVARVGLDLSPVALDDDEERRWLEACLWPDQPERIDRFRAAVDVFGSHPVPLVAGDMVDDLDAVARSLLTGHDDHLVVMCSWALTYVRRDRREAVGDTLAGLAADGRAVTWVSAEPPGAVPGIPPAEGRGDGDATVLGIRRWRHGRERPPEHWALAHPHGAWFERTAG